MGYSTQYDRAVKIANDLKQEYGSKLSFNGHSLGGGLSSTAALVTGLEATVFNPAGVNGITLWKHNSSKERADELITAIRLDKDVLTTLQDSNVWIPTPWKGVKIPLGYIMPDTLGTVYPAFPRWKLETTIHKVGFSR